MKFLSKLSVSFSSFVGLRRILDAEIKQVHAAGVTNEKADKEPVTDEEEERMWQQGVLDEASAKTLLHTINFSNGKIFGMRSQEHRQLRLGDIKIEDDKTTVYRENFS